MGRSVNVPENAVATCYVIVGDFSRFGNDDWNCWIESLQDLIGDWYPSFAECDRWADQEEHVILANEHADIVVCEYCGVVSVSLVPRLYYHGGFNALHAAWCRQVARRFRERVNEAYGDAAVVPLATASNGETAYRAIPRKDTG